MVHSVGPLVRSKNARRRARLVRDGIEFRHRWAVIKGGKQGKGGKRRGVVSRVPGSCRVLRWRFHLLTSQLAVSPWIWGLFITATTEGDGFHRGTMADTTASVERGRSGRVKQEVREKPERRGRTGTTAYSMFPRVTDYSIYEPCRMILNRGTHWCRVDSPRNPFSSLSLPPSRDTSLSSWQSLSPRVYPVATTVAFLSFPDSIRSLSATEKKSRRNRKSIESSRTYAKPNLLSWPKRASFSERSPKRGNERKYTDLR